MRSYMKNEEFKKRQMWLDFGCAASIAYEVLQKCVMDFRKWFKKWKPKTKVIKPVNLAKWLWIELVSVQLEMVYVIPA